MKKNKKEKTTCLFNKILEEEKKWAIYENTELQLGADNSG